MYKRHPTLKSLSFCTCSVKLIQCRCTVTVLPRQPVLPYLALPSLDHGQSETWISFKGLINPSHVGYVLGLLRGASKWGRVGQGLGKHTGYRQNKPCEISLKWQHGGTHFYIKVLQFESLGTQIISNKFFPSFLYKNYICI